MKPPKEPKSFKYPRLYWRPMKHEHSFIATLVIIYPKGRRTTERTAFHNQDASVQFFNINGNCLPACWDEDWFTPEERVLRLKEYAQNHGIKTIFLGEIK